MLTPAYLGHHPAGPGAPGYLPPELSAAEAGLAPSTTHRPSPSKCGQGKGAAFNKRIRKGPRGVCEGREWQAAPPQSCPVPGRPLRVGLNRVGLNPALPPYAQDQSSPQGEQNHVLPGAVCSLRMHVSGRVHPRVRVLAQTSTRLVEARGVTQLGVSFGCR